MGHEFRFWEAGKEAAFEVFDEFSPEVYLGTSYETDRAITKCIAKRPEMKVAMFGSAWGPYLADVDLKKYPIVVATEQEKHIVENLRKQTGKPDFVFIHAHGRWLDGTMSGWSELGIPYSGILNAADTIINRNGRHRPELQCDVGFVGGYWGYKARNLSSYLLPLCHPDSGLDVKIFGNQPWPTHRWLGGCSDEEACDLFVSATVCPNVSEPHSTDLGFDCIERIFKVPAAGGFVISDYVEEAADLFEHDELPMAGTPKRMEELVRYFVDNPGSRTRYMERMKKKVYSKHTYFDRVSQIFSGLSLDEESKKCMELKTKLLGQCN
jgi:hypothetical protein